MSVIWCLVYILDVADTSMKKIINGKNCSVFLVGIIKQAGFYCDQKISGIGLCLCNDEEF